MSNERDHISEYFEAKGVSRGEFEALKRFGDHEELHDGTLMRAEDDKEFRIYCEDIEGCPIGIGLTEGVLNLFADRYSLPLKAVGSLYEEPTKSRPPPGAPSGSATSSMLPVRLK